MKKSDDKRIKTNLSRYGVDNVSKLDWVKQRGWLLMKRKEIS